ncbi:hypothetical protein CJ739_387 [Mariniflexile rhizosphaerae]|nr:hypothetical protein CJ739_387 [Mariniflexile sp. TRM1-10]
MLSLVNKLNKNYYTKPSYIYIEGFFILYN